jgi:mono/diheme cytochrome c family protein
MAVRRLPLVSAVVIVMLVPAMFAAPADRKLRALQYDSKAELPSTNVPDSLARDGVTLAQAPREAAPLAPEMRAARLTYLTQCSQCHGTDAKGSAAASNLRAFKGTEDNFLRIVREGRAGTGMTPWKGLISDEDIRDIARYIKQLSGESG